MSEISGREWAMKLFNRSPLKQRKWRQICKLLREPAGLVCLDIGSDNGVISMLLRERGGTWHSADLIPETVESIRTLVGERVELIDGRKTPYPDRYFDQIIIVDFLEHIETDCEFAAELLRILKPGGALIINVPNPKQGLLRRIRYLLGQTDEKHGHVRPGYSLDQLRALLGPQFEIERSEQYSRVFSELIDTVITFALDRLQSKGRTKKGSVVTGADLKKMEKSFKLYSLIYPFVAGMVKLDACIPFCHGNMLIARATSREK